VLIQAGPHAWLAAATGGLPGIVRRTESLFIDVMMIVG